VFCQSKDSISNVNFECILGGLVVNLIYPEETRNNGCHVKHIGQQHSPENS
jgi:hypothetical protein